MLRALCPGGIRFSQVAAIVPSSHCKPAGDHLHWPWVYACSLVDRVGLDRKTGEAMKLIFRAQALSFLILSETHSPFAGLICLSSQPQIRCQEALLMVAVDSRGIFIWCWHVKKVISQVVCYTSPRPLQGGNHYRMITGVSKCL